MKSYMIKILASFLFFQISFCAFSQSELFEKKQYVNEEGEKLQYRQMISDYDTISKYPLVIFLHGSGERGNDNEAQLKWGVKAFTDPQLMATFRHIVIAPQCPQNESWSNYNYEDMSLEQSPSIQMELLRELIDELLVTLPIDPNRVYITGLSMGGFGTFDALSRYPELFAAAVPICGGGDPRQAQKMASVPIWIFHGAKDTSVSPQLSVDMYDALLKVGAKPGFTIYPEAGHFSWIPAYSDDMLMNWLFRQKKN